MAIDKIKNLFKVKEIEKIPTNNSQDSINETLNETQRKRTYHETGYRDSSRNSGNQKALQISLEAIYAKWQNEERELQDKQIKLKEPYLKEQNQKQTELKGLNISVDSKLSKIQELDRRKEEAKQQIEQLKFEINDLTKNPEAYNVNAKKGASTKFWIGLFLLIPISLYLITFYISTSYSAFFKNFESDLGVLPSILDPNALTKAWKDGYLEGSFVTLIPFVFMGLGYLIHMFGENKSFVNHVKIVVLFIITFIFDAILAYQIENKLYEFTKTLNSPEFNLGIAFTKVEFWGIIFAGFVVYMIWGLVFDFVMKEHKERDKIKNAQLKRQQDIGVYQERIQGFQQQTDELRTEINNLKELIEKAKGRITELQQIIEGIIIPTREYVLYAAEYMQGWTTFIFEKLPVSQSEKKEIVEKCFQTYEAHLKHNNVSQSSQNTIYISELLN